MPICRIAIFKGWVVELSAYVILTKQLHDGIGDLESDLDIRTRCH